MILPFSLAWLAGASSIVLWSDLPPAWLAWVLIAIAGLALLTGRPGWRLSAGFCLGVALALVAAESRMADRLPPTLAGEDIRVVGTVSGLPAVDSRRVRFRFRVESAVMDGTTAELPGQLRLAWYGRQRPELATGERWTMTVRLRAAGGFANPGGFDHAGWLLREGIAATGSVRSDPRARRLEAAGPTLHGVRSAIRSAIIEPEGRIAHAGVLNALAVGDRSAITADTWEVLLATGTNHLVAISGLHVGLAAFAGFVVGRSAWRLLPPLRRRVARPVFAAVTGLLLAGAYAALAGFAIPTQRALAMLVAGLGALALRRRVRPGEVIALALLAVLLIDPLSPLAPGFWLSFGAVAAILWILCGRVGQPGRAPAWIRMQFAIAVALLPLLLLLFSRASVTGPLANLVAVPWVSIGIVPPVLTGSLLSLVSPTLGGWVLQFADLIAGPLFRLLEQLASPPWAQLRRPEPGPLAMGLGIVGVALLLAPRALPGRTAGAVCMLPLVLAPSPGPGPGMVWLDVLDVGRGLSVVVRTQSHTLLYDTGPRLSPGFDAGAAVVVPFLRSTGIDRVDALVLSSSANRHAGGAESVVTEFPPARLLSSDTDLRASYGGEACRRHLEWTWDGVRFRFLHPQADDTFAPRDRSCVLRIDAPGGTILLPGAIGQRGQWFLLARRERLRADVLLAPIGAGGTMVDEFVQAVRPKWIVVPGSRSATGGRAGNRPPGEHGGAGIARTDCAGRIRFVLAPDESVTPPVAWREENRRFWHPGCFEPDKSVTMRAIADPVRTGGGD